MLGRRKQVETSAQQQPGRVAAATQVAATQAAATQASPRPEAPVRGQMHIGKSVHIKGELTANEEMTIDGTVEGSIVVENHQLTIGASGHITADVRARSIVVYGKVVGNLSAEERAEVRNGGTVEGDIQGPRVVLADGAVFKGSIDMGSTGAAEPATGGRRGGSWSPGTEVQAAAGPTVDDLPAPFGQDGGDAAAAASPQGTSAADKQKLANLF